MHFPYLTLHEHMAHIWPAITSYEGKVIPAATTHNSHAHHSQLCSHSSQPWLCPLPYLHHIRDVPNGELIAGHGL